MLLEYLKNNYKENEPIFIADIELPVTDINLRQMFKNLCDKGEIRRYDNGIYYLPGASRLKGGSSLSAGEVTRCKYITRNKRIEGYYSGYTFANQLGLTEQVPVTIEIVSNCTSAKYREISIKNQRVVLRKPCTEITKENYKVLQMLDLLKDVDLYMDNNRNDAMKRLFSYVKRLGIKKEEVDRYIGFYPERVYKNIYETRVYDAFA